MLNFLEYIHITFKNEAAERTTQHGGPRIDHPWYKSYFFSLQAILLISLFIFRRHLKFNLSF